MSLSPAPVLEELLRYRTSSLGATEWFETQKHNEDLCPAVNDKLIDILDCFAKYQAISYDVQGFRDQGVDVVLQYGVGIDETVEDRVVAIQVKSFPEFEQGRVARDLKTQFMDARRRYGTQLERYYVMLCTNGRKHLDRVRDLNAELSAEKQIRIVEPRYAFTFLHLPTSTVAGTVDRLLRKEDSVRKAARSEVEDLNPLGLAAVLDALIFERSPVEIERSATHPSEPIMRIAATLLEAAKVLEAVGDTYSQLEDSVFRRCGEGWELVVSDFRAIQCTLLDAEIRFGYSGSELFEYMFETFCRSALAPLGERKDQADDE